MSRVLVIGDLHAPCMHERYLDFVQEVEEKYATNRVVLIGDVADNHLCSLHPKEHDALSPKVEAEQAKQQIQQVYKLYPSAKVCIGNHDIRAQLRAAEVSMPTVYLKTYNQVWKTPGWDWENEHAIEGVLYVHGTGSSGKNAALTNAQANMMNLVQGHTHAYAGVQWFAGPRQAIFGLNVGCGLDPRSYGARYGINLRTRPVLGCGVVIDGEEAYFVKMDLGRKAQAAKHGRYGRK